MASTLVGQVRKPAPPALSAREAEVLRRVAQGRTNPEIGKRLYIAEATVKDPPVADLQHVYVDDRTAAAATAMARRRHARTRLRWGVSRLTAGTCVIRSSQVIPAQAMDLTAW